jgi:SWI/SNF-related matrix-associated actin-dependent regulator of chromatin subfamily A protein 2/4
MNHIDKIFNKLPDNEKNNNLQEHINIIPNIVNISKKNTMKIQHQASMGNENNKINFNVNNNNNDNNYYCQLLKKISEEEKVGNHSNQNTVMKKKNIHIIKPGMLKKEKSQANIKGNKFNLNYLSNCNNNIFLKNKETHSPHHRKKIIIEEEKKDDVIVLFKAKNKTDNNNNKNLKNENETNNTNNNNDNINNNENHYKKEISVKENLTNNNNNNNNNSNQDSNLNNNNEFRRSPKNGTKKTKSNLFNLKEEKIQKTIHFEIINQFRIFKNLEIKKIENFLHFPESKPLKNVNQYLITINDKRIINNHKKNTESGPLLSDNNENNFNDISRKSNENKSIISNKTETKKKRKIKSFCCF